MRAVLVLLALAALLIAAWRDLAGRTIPDRAALALLGLGIALRLPAGAAAVAVSLGAALLLFGLLALLHAAGGLGGGDVKLAAGLAAALPPAALPGFILVTALAGGGLCFVHLGLRLLPRSRPRRDAGLLRRLYAVERWRVARHGSLPYGVAIACGGAWALLAQ
jgi:prepilin peptidase CpaA